MQYVTTLLAALLAAGLAGCGAQMPASPAAETTAPVTEEAPATEAALYHGGAARTPEEALLAVDPMYREGSFGLGAGRLRTVFRIVLPSAVPGILSGIILATGRIVGETAALIYTAGTAANHPETLMTSVRTLSVHMYVLSGEGLHIDQAYATAAVLLAVVAGINALSSFIAKRLNKGVRG